MCVRARFFFAYARSCSYKTPWVSLQTLQWRSYQYPGNNEEGKPFDVPGVGGILPNMGGGGGRSVRAQVAMSCPNIAVGNVAWPSARLDVFEGNREVRCTSTLLVFWCLKDILIQTFVLRLFYLVISRGALNWTHGSRNDSGKPNTVCTHAPEDSLQLHSGTRAGWKRSGRVPNG